MYQDFSRGNEGRGIVAGVVDCKSALETFGDVAERFDADLRHGILSVRVMRSDLKTNGKHTLFNS